MEADPARHIPVDLGYEWPPVMAADDFQRVVIDEQGRPWIDGHHVNFTMHRRFCAEWLAFVEADPEAIVG